MRLRELKEQAGLSGYALAKKAGLTTGAYYALEAGSTKPTYDSLLSLARALGEALGKPASEVLTALTDVDQPSNEVPT
jgi:transcriptional regulator with XRE-family HTH domain